MAETTAANLLDRIRYALGAYEADPTPDCAELFAGLLEEVLDRFVPLAPPKSGPVSGAPGAAPVDQVLYAVAAVLEGLDGAVRPDGQEFHPGLMPNELRSLAAELADQQFLHYEPRPGDEFRELAGRALDALANDIKRADAWLRRHVGGPR